MTPELVKALEFFDKAHEKLHPAVPEGFFTARQYAEQKGGVSTQAMKRRLDALVVSKLALSHDGFTGPRNNVLTRFYRIIPQ